jgi:hypothetical protein
VGRGIRWKEAWDLHRHTVECSSPSQCEEEEAMRWHSVLLGGGERRGALIWELGARFKLLCLSTIRWVTQGGHSDLRTQNGELLGCRWCSHISSCGWLG